MTTRNDLYNQLTDLGREYSKPLLAGFPNNIRQANIPELERRIIWMQRAIELKPINRNLAYSLSDAAWNDNYIDQTLMVEAGFCPKDNTRLITDSNPGLNGDDYVEIAVCPKCGTEY